MKCGSFLNFFFSPLQNNNMAGKVDDKTIHDLRVFADRLRINSIRSTNASKSG